MTVGDEPTELFTGRPGKRSMLGQAVEEVHGDD